MSYFLQVSRALGARYPVPSVPGVTHAQVAATPLKTQPVSLGAILWLVKCYVQSVQRVATVPAQGNTVGGIIGSMWVMS